MDLDWNINENGWTALHVACSERHDSIVSLLLAHPDIDVNRRDNRGFTPFYVSCVWASLSCVQVLLKDSRVDVNQADKWGCTPLKETALRGYVDIIRCWIASGRTLDLAIGNENTDAIAAAQKVESWHNSFHEAGKKEVLQLLRNYVANMVVTKNPVIQSPGITGKYALKVKTRAKNTLTSLIPRSGD